MMKTEPRILAYTLTLLGAINLACANTPAEGSATGTEGSSSGTDGSASAASNTTPTTTQGSASNSATESTVSGNSNSGMTEATTADLTTDGLTGTGPDTTDNTTGVVDTSDTGPGTSTSTTDTSTGTSTTDASTGTGTSTTDASTSTTDASTGTTGNGTTGDVVECGLQLKATIRDFKLGHPDFETYCCGVVPGLVKADLGADKKPVFNQVGNPKMLTDAPTFNQWYNNTKDVNQSTQIVLDLQEIQPGVYSYQNNSFFPIDNQLFGNEGNGHNFHFTTYFNTS